MDNLKGKRLLLLGGSLWKNAIRQFAEENGVRLIAVGNDLTAGIFEISEEKYQIDSTDSEKMKSFIKDKKIDGVYMGGSEAVITCASKYLKELELPCYCTPDQWELLQNKHHFKALCQKHGLPVVPKYELDKNNLGNSLPPSAFPIVLKPADGCGSNGFSVCKSYKDIEKSYSEAAEYSPTHSVICEKFVNNKAIVVFYSISDDIISFLGSEDKTPVKFTTQGSYVAGLFVSPSTFEDEFRLRYEDKIKAMFKSIGLYEGSIWIEVFHDEEDDEYYFNEVGFRYGGSISVYPMDYLSGINQIFKDLYFSLQGKSWKSTTPSIIPHIIPRGKKYCVYPIYVNAGVITRYEGEESLNNSLMVFFTTTKAIGTDVKDTGSFSQNVALAHFVYDRKEECINMINHIHKVFRVYDSHGNNMVNRMLSDKTLYELDI